MNLNYLPIHRVIVNLDYAVYCLWRLRLIVRRRHLHRHVVCISERVCSLHVVSCKLCFLLGNGRGAIITKLDGSRSSWIEPFPDNCIAWLLRA